MAVIFFISGDRYIAVKFPLRYREIVTRQRIKKAVVVALFITGFGAVQEIVIAARDSATKLYTFYWTLNIIVVTSLVLLCIIGIAVLYLYIYLETRRQEKRPQQGPRSKV